MKKVNIPIFQTTLKIYKGSERDKFTEDTTHTLPSEYYGCCAGPHIWVNNDIGACYHEATHFADWLLMDRLQCKMSNDLWDHTELRAYIVQYVGDKVREYCYEQDNPQ